MMALNMYNTKGLKPPPWLENVCFTPHIQMKYHLPKTKVQRQLKKDQEALSNMVQPEIVVDQLEQLFEDISMSNVPFLVSEITVILQIIEPRHEDTVFEVSGQVRHKAGCTAKLDG